MKKLFFLLILYHFQCQQIIKRVEYTYKDGKLIDSDQKQSLEMDQNLQKLLSLFKPGQVVTVSQDGTIVDTSFDPSLLEKRKEPVIEYQTHEEIVYQPAQKKEENQKPVMYSDIDLLKQITDEETLQNTLQQEESKQKTEKNIVEKKQDNVMQIFSDEEYKEIFKKQLQELAQNQAKQVLFLQNLQKNPIDEQTITKKPVLESPPQIQTKRVQNQEPIIIKKTQPQQQYLPPNKIVRKFDILTNQPIEYEPYEQKMLQQGNQALSLQKEDVLPLQDSIIQGERKQQKISDLLGPIQNQAQNDFYGRYNQLFFTKFIIKYFFKFIKINIAIFI